MKTSNPLHIGTTLKCFVFLSTLLAVPSGSLSANETSLSCQQNALQKSQRLIRFILDDLSATYTQVGGGGISNIKQTATNAFRVSIAQEERIDQISYQLKFEQDCQITLVKRKSTAVSPWERPH